MIKKKYHRLRILFLVILLFVLSFFIIESTVIKQYLLNPLLLKEFILTWGFFGPLAIIILQIFQAMFSFIPSQLTTIIAGFVFGPVLGLIYSLIGAFLGSMFVFSLARKYGKTLALKFFEKKDLVHFNMLFRQHRLRALFLARVAPLFPNDLVSLGAGLTGIRLRDFNLISSLGFVVQMTILTYFGSELSSERVNLSLILASLGVCLLFFVVLFEKQIKRRLIRDFYKLEKEGRILEKKIEMEFKKI